MAHKVAQAAYDHPGVMLIAGVLLVALLLGTYSPEQVFAALRLSAWWLLGLTAGIWAVVRLWSLVRN